MSAAQANVLELSLRQRRILFRSWHRGMREMDLILGRFADAEIANLNMSDLDDFERLLEVPDRDLFSWVTGEFTPAPSHDTPLFRKILAFHNPAAPFEA